MKSLSIVAAIILAWYAYERRNPSVTYPPGILIPDDPIQTEITPNDTPFTVGKFHLTPLAHFALDARVLHRKTYRYDSQAALVPVDLAVGWGPMSDQAVLDQLQISQGRRFFFFEWQRQPPLDPGQITRHATNLHLIPSSPPLEDLCKSLNGGELIHLQGLLVEATGTGNRHVAQLAHPNRQRQRRLRTGLARGTAPASLGETVAPDSFPFHGGKMSTEKATFGAGCFWGVESVFRQSQGVKEAIVGYAGGATENPTYEDVCSDETGHAEVVEVTFDPAEVSYEQLLDVFWRNHDPTTRDRQGPDIGSQYRSVVFYHSPAQKSAAEAKRAELEKSGRFRRPIVTQIEPAPTFYRAEEYHQQYLAKHGRTHCAL